MRYVEYVSRDPSHEDTHTEGGASHNVSRPVVVPSWKSALRVHHSAGCRLHPG
jgi:hypothetical protein